MTGMGPKTDQPPEKLLENARWLNALPALLAVAAFFPVLGHGFIWDDVPLIVRNMWVQDLQFLGRLWKSEFWATQDASNALGGLGGRYYRPWVTTAFAFQWHLGQGAPGVFHSISLLLHVACTLLVQSMLRLRLMTVSTSPWVSVLGASWFAVHPTRVESVAWVSGSTELWMAFWVLLGWHVWHRFGDRLWSFPVTGLVLTLAALSKETAFVAPALFLADSYGQPEVPRGKRRNAWALMLLMAALAVARARAFPLGIPLELNLAMVERVLSSFGYYWLLAATFLPISVQFSAIDWGPSGELILPGYSVALGAFGFVAVGLLAAAAFRRPWARTVLSEAAWVFLPLLPVANLIPLQMNVLVTARFWYLPWVGMVLLSGRALSVFPKMRHALLAVGLLATGAWAFATSRHVPHFARNEDLWKYEAMSWPDHILPKQMMQNIAAEQGRLQEARQWGLSALHAVWEGRPEKWRAGPTVFALDAVLKAEPARNFQDTRAVRNFLEELFASRRAVLELDGRTFELQLAPKEVRSLADTLYAPYLVLAEARLQTGDLDGALWVLRTATLRKPRVKDGWILMAYIHGLRAEWTQAEAAVQQALPLLTDAEGRELRQLFLQCAQSGPATPGNSIRMAECQASFHGIQWARKTLDEALQVNAHSFPVWEARIRLERRLDNEPGARALLEQGRRQLPEAAEGWKALEDEGQARPE